MQPNRSRAHLRVAADPADAEYVAPLRMQNLASWAEFAALTPETQEAMWKQLRHEQDALTEGRALHEDVLPAPPPPSKPQHTWTPQPAKPGWNLDDIPPTEYVQRLTGVEVQTRRPVPCPFPDHDDSTASFHAYDSGFNCFGCNRGGRIFDFAAALWGYSGVLRGDTFREVRDRLLEVFPPARAA